MALSKEITESYRKILKSLEKDQIAKIKASTCRRDEVALAVVFSHEKGREEGYEDGHRDGYDECYEIYEREIIDGDP